MPYSGLLALGLLAVVGIILGLWSQHRQGGERELAGKETAKEEAAAAGEEAVPTGIAPELVAAIAAAIAADSATPHRITIRRTLPQANYWVLSGRQELLGAVPPNFKWRSGR
ncbi:hypothetical protein MGLY_09630 [Neomoorella glycerini]|uniref:Oxaloacetate decarboxylase, gamma chain n=1 Tax=Neomoorella glycerini TaxID=55779 RepID=A0A6I5ZNX4_9FIRM|nr:OadG family transporter subunit [Moorella glycerini]QGP91622.1 hypothetical protein MGLY_09630 [Moorella glycerini]